MKTLKILATVLIVFMVAFTSCERDDSFTDNNTYIPENIVTDDTDDTGNLDPFFDAIVSRSFLGQVVDENTNGISGANVNVEDQNGIYR